MQQLQAMHGALQLDHLNLGVLTFKGSDMR